MVASYIQNLATLSTVAALCISSHSILMHLINFHQHSLQVLILRILIMIPVRIRIVLNGIGVRDCNMDVN